MGKRKLRLVQITMEWTTRCPTVLDQVRTPGQYFACEEALAVGKETYQAHAQRGYMMFSSEPSLSHADHFQYVGSCLASLLKVFFCFATHCLCLVCQKVLPGTCVLRGETFQRMGAVVG